MKVGFLFYLIYFLLAIHLSMKSEQHAIAIKTRLEVCFFKAFSDGGSESYWKCGSLEKHDSIQYMSFTCALSHVSAKMLHASLNFVTLIKHRGCWGFSLTSEIWFPLTGSLSSPPKLPICDHATCFSCTDFHGQVFDDDLCSEKIQQTLLLVFQRIPLSTQGSLCVISYDD